MRAATARVLGRLRDRATARPSSSRRSPTRVAVVRTFAVEALGLACARTARAPACCRADRARAAGQPRAAGPARARADRRRRRRLDAVPQAARRSQRAHAARGRRGPRAVWRPDSIAALKRMPDRRQVAAKCAWRPPSPSTSSARCRRTSSRRRWSLRDEGASGARLPPRDRAVRRCPASSRR